MTCTNEIHDEFLKMNELLCQFCHKRLKENEPIKYHECCIDQNLSFINGFQTCINCGSIHHPEFVFPFFNFNEYIYKLKKKSIYLRKYHIQNVLSNICQKNNLQLTNEKRKKILSMFVKIDSIKKNN